MLICIGLQLFISFGRSSTSLFAVTFSITVCFLFLFLFRSILARAYKNKISRFLGKRYMYKCIDSIAHNVACATALSAIWFLLLGILKFRLCVCPLILRRFILTAFSDNNSNNNTPNRSSRHEFGDDVMKVNDLFGFELQLKYYIRTKTKSYTIVVFIEA